MPQQAGRALAAFERGISLYKESQDVPAIAGARRGSFQVVIYGVVNPEPDADAMATALIRLAREQLRKREKD